MKGCGRFRLTKLVNLLLAQFPLLHPDSLLIDLSPISPHHQGFIHLTLPLLHPQHLKPIIVKGDKIDGSCDLSFPLLPAQPVPLVLGLAELNYN